MFLESRLKSRLLKMRAPAGYMTSVRLHRNYWTLRALGHSHDAALDGYLDAGGCGGCGHPIDSHRPSTSILLVGFPPTSQSAYEYTPVWLR